MNNQRCSTIKLYDKDAYASNFEAKIVAITCIDDKTIDIVLNQTLFFPEEGGQNSDVGTISISDCKYIVGHVSTEQDGDMEIIRHRVSIDENLMKEIKNDMTVMVGSHVVGEIDWMDRYDKMQNHSGEHILSGLIHNEYGYDNVGFHLGNEVFTMDLNGTFTKEQLENLEAKANAIVYENVAITADYYENDKLENMEFRSKKKFDTAVRIVKVGEYDTCACCAPHVRYTGEIGIIKIIKAENWKGGMRLTVVCGARAYRDYIKKHTMLQELAARFSTSEEKLPDIIDNMQKNIAKAEHDLAVYSTEQIYKELIENASQCENGKVILFTEVSNAQAIRTAVDKAMTEKPEYIFGVLCGEDATGYRYLIGSRELDVKASMAETLNKLNAKGGGNKDMLQGMIKLPKDAINTELN